MEILRKIGVIVCIFSVGVTSYASTEIRKDSDFYMSPKFSIATYINAKVDKTDIRSNRGIYMTPKFSIDTYNTVANPTQLGVDRCVYMSSPFDVIGGYNVNYNVNDTTITEDIELTLDSEFYINAKFQALDLGGVSEVNYTIYDNGEEFAPKTNIMIKDSSINEKVNLDGFIEGHVYSIVTKILLKDGRMVGFISPNLYVDEKDNIFGVTVKDKNILVNKKIDVDIHVATGTEFKTFELALKNELTGDIYNLTDYNKDSCFINSEKGIDYYRVIVETSDVALKKFSIIVKLRN